MYTDVLPGLIYLQKLINKLFCPSRLLTCYSWSFWVLLTEHTHENIGNKYTLAHAQSSELVILSRLSHLTVYLSKKISCRKSVRLRNLASWGKFSPQLVDIQLYVLGNGGLPQARSIAQSIITQMKIYDQVEWIKNSNLLSRGNN
jgi:hypothetical protein